MKPFNPYVDLKNRILAFIVSFKHPRRRTMFLVKKDTLGSVYMKDVYERVHAAQQIGGWEVVLTANPEGLLIEYREIPDPGGLEYL
jgi:hypothetical protein